MNPIYEYEDKQGWWTRIGLEGSGHWFVVQVHDRLGETSTIYVPLAEVPKLIDSLKKITHDKEP